ncbi:MAG: cyclic nucleotide-binding domain-containing protein [Magnetococcales bacterium]|nr:cyclic nucleotide-binding domain-containing protein [Magnetococcales bacterium]
MEQFPNQQDHNTLPKSVIRPGGRFKTVWNYLVLLATFWYAMIVPFQVAMSSNHELEPAWIFTVDLLLTLFFITDIWISFRTAFMQDGETIADLKIIQQRYLRGWFALDLLATLPLGWYFLMQGDFESGTLLGLFRLLRVVKLHALFRLFNLGVSLRFHAQLALLFFWISVGINWLACGWMWLVPNQSGDDWVSFTIEAYYWVVTTLTTVGYGDITPIDNPTRIYTMGVMLVGVGMYGMVIGNISSLLVSSNQYKYKKRQKIENLVSFMRQYKVPINIQNEVYGFYRHFLLEQAADDRTILQELPEAIQSRIYSHINVMLLRQVPLFEKASEECLMDLEKRLESMVCSPGEELFKAGTMGEDMYFLTHGAVEVFSADGRLLAKLRRRSFFGELSLIYEKPRNATIRSATFCDMFRLKKSDFLQVISNCPHFKNSLEKALATRYGEETKGLVPVWNQRQKN